MRQVYRDDKVKFYIGDIRDLASIKNAMHGVDYVFQAAALKQVRSCEFFPMEAVKTNVIGTDNVLTAAIDCGSGKDADLRDEIWQCYGIARFGYSTIY